LFKFVENVGADIGSQDDIFADMPSLHLYMNKMIWYKKKDSLPLENYGILEIISSQI